MRTRLQKLTSSTAVLVGAALCGIAVVLLGIGFWQQGKQADRTRDIVHQNQVTSDRRWCHLLLLIKSPPGPPPQTAAGQHFNDAITRLFEDFHCG